MDINQIFNVVSTLVAHDFVTAGPWRDCNDLLGWHGISISLGLGSLCGFYQSLSISQHYMGLIKRPCSLAITLSHPQWRKKRRQGGATKYDGTQHRKLCISRTLLLGTGPKFLFDLYVDFVAYKIASFLLSLHCPLAVLCDIPTLRIFAKLSDTLVA